MKKSTILLMVLFISACDDGQAEPSEMDDSNESTETEETETADTETEADDKEIIEGNVDSEGIDNEDIAEDEPTEINIQEFTNQEQQEMTQLFYDWAVERAEIGGMAVTTLYFNHGAGGSGDWYAMTPDGEVQAQNLNNPGFNHFMIHAVGGVAFYEPVSGDHGIDEHAHIPGTAEGYSRLALPDTKIHKYMLADNGVVYELIAKKENMALSSGFGEYADDGTRGNFTPNVGFEISQDQDAQQEWRRILRMYEG